MKTVARRTFLRVATGAALLPALPRLAPPAFADAADPEPSFGARLAGRPIAVLRAAANRIIPPFDPGEPSLAFRGAGEEGTVEYVLNLLTAFDVSPPRIYPSVGAPGFTGTDATECEGGHFTVPEGWIALPPEKEIGWRAAVARFQERYAFGLGTDAGEGQLDRDGRAIFGTGFVELTPAQQTLLLEQYDAANAVTRISGVYSAGGGEAALQEPYQQQYGGSDPRADFFSLLFVHTMEAIYGDPIYRGADPADPSSRIGWRLAGFGGPHHPQGYSDAELETYGNCALPPPINRKLPENL